jgi:hypothetical protein
MWTGEIREWSFSDRIIQGELTGRIYKSKNCRWANWEYPDGTYISIQVYHYPDIDRLKYVPYCDLNESLNNYMRLSLGCFDGKTAWYWDVKQTGIWNPCSLNFKLYIGNKEPKVEDYILDIGCLVSEYPRGYKYWWNAKDHRELSWHNLPKRKRHQILYSIGNNYQCPDCKLMGSINTFEKDYPYCLEARMSITNDEDKEEAEVIPHPKLSIISGGRDNTSNWLMSLKEGSVFFCRSNKDEKDFTVLQFHIIRKWDMTVILHSNFPMNQEGDFPVHSLKFSQQHTMVDLIQDGESEYDFRRQDEERTD